MGVDDQGSGSQNANDRSGWPSEGNTPWQNARRYRSGARAALKAAMAKMGDFDEEVLDVLRHRGGTPLAWRVVIEDESRGWGHQVAVLEVLVRDQAHADEFLDLWWNFDGSECAEIRALLPTEYVNLLNAHVAIARVSENLPARPD